VIPQKKEIERTPVYFTREEMEIVMCSPSAATSIGRRDRGLLCLLYSSGARAQEICDLKVRDIRFAAKTKVKLVGKGNKGCEVTIPSDCASVVQSYLERSGKAKSMESHVFSTQVREHMTISCVEEIVKKYVSMVKLANPCLFREKVSTPHSFRHSIAVHMLEAGIPLVVIKNFIGHASLESTLIYEQ
jgi:site-specific recombinase XerD